MALETPEQREHRIAYLKAYREKNKAVLKARVQEKKAKLPKKPKKTRLPASEARERQRQAAKRYQEANRKVLAERTAAARAANPEKTRAQWLRHTNARRARKLNAVTGDLALIDSWMESWKSKRRVTCYWCVERFSPKKCHADHIVALAKGGAHSVDNLCISCGSCNAHKSAKSVENWNSEISRPVLL